MKKTVSIFVLLFSGFVLAQNQENDTLKSKELKEVILIGKKADLHEKQVKSLGSIDEFLQQSSKVNMIKRGAYAWEPIINNMPSERTLITIDGMRIFGACTDKMDPITSYVEVSNLSEATITSGQEGSCFGNTIGGSIDLKRNKTFFGEKNWKIHVNSGFETNNNQKILGTSVNYNDSLFYVDSDVMIRNAENYKAGNNKEVLFSQFNKTNFSNTFGFKLKENKIIETSLIYDKATDIGYPALPMDVSLAEAIITSLKYEYIPLNSTIKHWETKIYFNTIKHKMDDTTRPNVRIHMDMPGWSETFGYYSKATLLKEKHHFLINLNSFYNKSIAEMTMYPSDPNENLMFMYTWPNVRTLYNGVFLEDEYVFNCHSSLKITTAIGSHINHVASQFGLESMQIFYPEMKAQKNRILKSVSSKYNYIKEGFEYSFGLAYGERAPSVSEGYGFYLFNSFDGFDNIGNPNLKNEKALESSFSIGFKDDKFKINASTSYFKIYDYIIAKTDPVLVPMTIGANGVRIYTALDYATFFNASISAEVYLSNSFKWVSQVTYAKGKDNENNNLPFISPLSYNSSLRFSKNQFNAEISIAGNTTQTNFNPEFGEDRTPSYAIFNSSTGYKFKLGTNNFIAKLGAENLLDTYYSSYADWKNIPRMGRNFFINLNYSL
ncbi:TonB-dependent receptor [Flavobacterium sp. HNIBRBA15423]|uniref:TonB-dependent receptor n=1 Tax=Flavobacterium sp. HNIBRBA15423 TaxID=3458683 RepID=UPI004044DF1A